MNACIKPITNPAQAWLMSRHSMSCLSPSRPWIRLLVAGMKWSAVCVTSNSASISSRFNRPRSNKCCRPNTARSDTQTPGSTMRRLSYPITSLSLSERASGKLKFFMSSTKDRSFSGTTTRIPEMRLRRKVKFMVWPRSCAAALQWFADFGNSPAQCPCPESKCRNFCPAPRPA